MTTLSRAATRVVAALESVGRIISLLQLVCFLPLSLEHDKDTFLAFSASLALLYFVLSSLRGITAGSWLARIVYALTIPHNLVIPLLLWFCAHLYSPLPSANPAIVALRNGVRHASLAWLHPSALIEALTGAGDVLWPPVPEHISAAYTQLMREWLDLAYKAALYFLSRVPAWWCAFLLYSSPLFALLEGLSTLLVIQSFSQLSRWLINQPTPRSKRSKRNLFVQRIVAYGVEPSEAWQLLFLLFSATVYVIGAVALYLCFDGAATGRPYASAAIGASLASTLWISLMALAIRKANVVETSLMFAYVVFNVYELGTSPGLGGDTLAVVRAFKASRAQSAIPLILSASTGALFDRIFNAVEHTLAFLAAANAVLPTTVIVSLVYRLMVLYSAIRVLPRLRGYNHKRQAAPARSVEGTYSDSDINSVSAAATAAATEAAARAAAAAVGANASAPDDLSEAIQHVKEPDSVAVNAQHAEAEKETARVLAAAAAAAAAAAKKTRRRRKEKEPHDVLYRVLILYSRFVLIAVYSHLLLLDQNHQIYWRLLTVVFTLTLWSIELLLGAEDAVSVSVYE